MTTQKVAEIIVSIFLIATVVVSSVKIYQLDKDIAELKRFGVIAGKTIVQLNERVHAIERNHKRKY